jgi:hypothetical protein
VTALLVVLGLVAAFLAWKTLMLLAGALVLFAKVVVLTLALAAWLCLLPLRLLLR